MKENVFKEFHAAENQRPIEKIQSCATVYSLTMHN